MIDKNRLEEKCSTWNIALTGTQLDQLDAFAEILVEYNQKVNLTAITDPEGIEDKHFLDSLLFAAQPEVAGKMVDVGAARSLPSWVCVSKQNCRRAGGDSVCPLSRFLAHFSQVSRAAFALVFSSESFPRKAKSSPEEGFIAKTKAEPSDQKTQSKEKKDV